MKKILQQLRGLTFCVMPASVLVFCSWESPGMYNYANRIIPCYSVQKDTIPNNKQDDFEKAMKELDAGMDDLNVQMKNLDVNLDKQLESLSKINFDSIQKQAEASLKQIDWNKMQQDVNASLLKAQKEIAKIDFSKMQNEMKDLQEKFKSDEFKSQFNSEKLHKQIDEAMSHAKESMEKAKQKLQNLRALSDALAADGLIDKKKGYTIEWKSGELYINNKKQPKEIADKYRKYEDEGEIKIEPEGVEHF